MQRAGSLAAQPLPARAMIVAAGPAASVVAAALAFSALAFFVGETIAPPRVGSVVAGGAAERAGLMPGDLVRSIDGRPMATFEDVARIVSLRPGEPIALSIDRAGRETTVVATPALATIGNAGGASADRPARHHDLRDDAGVATSGRSSSARCGPASFAAWGIVAMTGDYAARVATGRLAPRPAFGSGRDRAHVPCRGVARRRGVRRAGGARFRCRSASPTFCRCPCSTAGISCSTCIEAARGRALAGAPRNSAFAQACAGGADADAARHRQRSAPAVRV